MRHLLTATTLALVLTPGAAFGGAWTQAEGDSYFKAYAKGLLGKQAFVEGRTTASLPATYMDLQLSLYGEYGVTDEVTAVLQATPFGVTAYDGETDPYIGEIIAGLRYRLSEGPVAAAVQVHAGGRPAQVRPTGATIIDGRQFRVTPVVGTLLGGGALHLGHSFGRTWLSGHAGARFHSAESLETALYAFLQFGWHILDTLTAALHISLWHALGDIEVIEVLGTGQTRYLGYGLGLTWWLHEEVGLHVGIDGAVYAEANAATPAFLLGVEFR